MFCGYLTAGRGVVLCELWLLRSRNSDIPTQSFFPILWWRHDESFVPARLLLSLHVVASKVERKWKGKFILFPSPLFLDFFFFLTASLYITRPTDPDLCYLSLNSQPLKATCLGSGPMTCCLAWQSGLSGFVTESNVLAMPHTSHPLPPLPGILF